MTKEQARRLAQKFVENACKDSNAQFGIDDEHTIETTFGWVFFYNTVEYLTTHDPLTIAVGNAPIIVDKESGEIHETGTAFSIEHYIAEFERTKGS